MNSPLKITVKPQAGLRVRKPDGGVLAATGETVASAPYWQRRLADGDVVKVASPETKAAATRTKPATGDRETA